MLNILRFLLISSAVFLLLACQSPAVLHTDSPFFRIPDGTVIELHRDLPLPADSDRVFIQRGQVTVHAINEGYPWCYFSVVDVQPVDRILKKGTFTVQRSRQDSREVVQWFPLKVASAGGSDWASPQTRLWIFYLKGDGTSAATRLSCGDAFLNPALAQLPDLRDIRETLGSVATLRLP